MKKIVVSTGDIKRRYDIIGPAYIQVSNKGFLGSTFNTLKKKYIDEILLQSTQENFSPRQGDWGFLYGEWSVGQNHFDEAFYICVRELQEKAERMGGDGIIWLRQDIDLDTTAFAYFYMQMYGTVVKFVEDEIDYNKLNRIIDDKYLDIILRYDREAVRIIEQKKKL